jgi:hypothetical protein
MRGCNKKGCKKTMRKSRKYRGGSNMNMNLAYPSNNVPTVPNPHLAYLGGKTGVEYPNPGPAPGGFNFLNPQQTQRGGCGCGLPLSGGSRRGKKGGFCPMCAAPLLLAGGQKMKGGSGNNGIPYPNGLVGSPWTPSSSGWPGVNGVSGDNNYLALNQYKVDPQTAMIATGANPPFSVGGGKRSRKQKGGALSNLFSQDLINLGRQIQYGVGSAYNGITGYPAPVNPLPWKGQMPNTTSLASVKAMI